MCGLNQQYTFVTPTIRPYRLVSTQIQLHRRQPHSIRRSLIPSFWSSLATERLQVAQHQSTMSSSSSYGSYGQGKGAYASRPSTSSTCTLPAPIRSCLKDESNIPAAYSAASSSLYTNSGSSSRSKAYSKPPIIHNGGGQIYDPNTSTSAPNGGYYK